MVAVLQQFLDVADPPVLRNTVVRLADTRRRLADVNSWPPLSSVPHWVPDLADSDGRKDALLVLQTRINRTYVQLNRQRIPGGA